MDLYHVRTLLDKGISLFEMKLRVTTYSRVSTTHLMQQNSLKNQTEHFEKMILTNPNWVYVSGYVDDGISGTTDYKRDCFMQMIEDAKRGIFDLIITKEISRFSRNTVDSIKYTRELLKYGVAVYFVNDNINTVFSDSEIRLTIMASLAQDEIRRLSERVKFGMNCAIQKGNILGNSIIYGYRKKNGKLVIVEQEALIVKKIYELYAISLKSLSEIVKILALEKINTSRGKNFRSSTLSRMISNPKYKGFYCGGKSEVVDYMLGKVRMIPKEEWVCYLDVEKVPPIVSEELWNMANERLEKRKIHFGNSILDKKNYFHHYLLSGKIWCEKDQVLFHRRCTCTSLKEVSWFCSFYLTKGKKYCAISSIRESELFQILGSFLEHFSLEKENIFQFLIELYQKIWKGFKSEEKKKICSREKKIRKKKEDLLEICLNTNLSFQDFSLKNASYEKELVKLEEEETNLKKDYDFFYLMKIMEEEFDEKWIFNQIYDLFLEKILVSSVGGEKDLVSLKIYFRNFMDDYEKKEWVENFSFKRGNETRGTRRYLMRYQVSIFLI